MPTRVYMNCIPGERRIHIELNAVEVSNVLDDFKPGADAQPDTLELHRILADAKAVFWPQSPRITTPKPSATETAGDPK